ncbi:MAG: YdcF family protein [Ilumatobacteraceae bacterium]
MSADPAASLDRGPGPPPTRDHAPALRIDPTAVEQHGDGEQDGSSGHDGSARRLWRRPWLRLCLWICAAAAGYYAINLVQVHLVGTSDQARPADAIIVLGAAQYDGRPSPQLQARLDHVVDLWNRGLAPLVVVTGGNQPGDRFTEAQVSATYLIEHGVDEAAILREDAGRSSWESLSTVADFLRDRGATRVLLVSDPYHSLRIRLMAEDLGLTAAVSPTRTSPVAGAAAFGREVKEAAGVAVGRIIGFDRLLSITG